MADDVAVRGDEPPHLEAGGLMLEFRILGPVQAVRGGRELALGGPRRRAVLALLLVAQLVLGRRPDFDLALFSPERS